MFRIGDIVQFITVYGRRNGRIIRVDDGFVVIESGIDHYTRATNDVTLVTSDRTNETEPGHMTPPTENENSLPAFEVSTPAYVVLTNTIASVDNPPSNADYRIGSHLYDTDHVYKSFETPEEIIEPTIHYSKGRVFLGNRTRVRYFNQHQTSIPLEGITGAIQDTLGVWWIRASTYASIVTPSYSWSGGTADAILPQLRSKKNKKKLRNKYPKPEIKAERFYANKNYIA